MNIHIRPGETIGVLGGTGSAKSSFAALIPRLYDVTRGEVRVGGIPVKDYDMASLRDNVAMVLQKNVLFSGTIKENLRWGKEDATGEEIINACRLAQADEFIRDFPAFKQKENTYACLFAFPEFLSSSEYFPQIIAEDTAGNITESRLIVNAVNRNYPTDKVKITETFLTLKEEELKKIAPGKETTLERYIEANGNIRKQNDQLISDVCTKNTSPKPKWENDFKILPRSAVKAQFGDRRTYYLGEKEIDKQVHLGYDFASVAKDNVPAGNHGTVVFAGYNGIYGNLVILEHGMGLNSIYSHLTELFVAVGDTVEKGQIIGTTGTTGLAVGDHVHFGIYLGGIAVQPKEWIDPKWVRSNISTRLSKAR